MLQPIVDVGLEYVKLGQPVPTLSGGEAQRLKLAGFLAEAVGVPTQRIARKGTLYLFDEPTTGLHFDDIAKLMRAFRKLLDAGHSIIVIEHNLDVIRASDWLIDLGPEGGDAGGRIVCTGTPEEVKRHAGSHTGVALVEYERAMGIGVAVAEEGLPLQSLLKARRDERRASEDVIRIVNAREHNLKSLDVSIPARALQRRHRRVGLGQEHARVRHPVQRRPAPLPRIAERLCAQHRAAGRAAGGGCGLRHSTDGRDRAAPLTRRAQEHGGDHHRGLALPAPALREARPSALHEGRRAGAPAKRREHRRAAAARPQGKARGAARAAGGGPQGRLHRPRQMGQGQGPQPPARGRRVRQGRPVAAARPFSRNTRWSCRSATSSSARRTRPSCATCLPARSNSARA